MKYLVGLQCFITTKYVMLLFSNAVKENCKTVNHYS